jgi:hypothetical protein
VLVELLQELLPAVPGEAALASAAP